MIDHRSSSHNLRNCKIKARENSDLNGIWTHDLCDNWCSALPTELSMDESLHSLLIVLTYLQHSPL